jgi:HEAT repeat protein
MTTRRLEKLTAVCWLAAAMTVLAVAADLVAADKIKEARKYTQDLKTSKDAKVRATALTELGKLGQIQKSLAADAAPLMVKALQDKNARVRAAAARSYGMIDADPKEAVPALLKLAKEDKDEDVKVAAVQGLGMMGPGASAATKDLRQIARSNKGKKNNLARAAQNAVRSINVKKP